MLSPEQTVADTHSLGIAAALGTAVAWGGAVVLFTRAGELVSAQGINLFKTVFCSGLFGLTWLLVGDPWTVGLGDGAVLVASGVVGIALADNLFFAALRRLGPARVALVECLYSPGVVLAAFMMLDERLDAWDGVGAALIVASLLVSAERPNRKADARTLWVGYALGAASMACMAVAIVGIKPILAEHSTMQATIVRLLGGAAALLLSLTWSPQLRVEGRLLLRPSPRWSRLIPAAILGNYISLYLWIAGFKYTHASTAGILNQTSTVWIVLLAAWFLKEPMRARTWVAVGLAFGGAILVMS